MSSVNYGPIVGNWQMTEAWNAGNEPGQKIYPWGQPPLGYWVYDNVGNFALQISINPPLPIPDSWWDLTTEQIVADMKAFKVPVPADLVWTSENYHDFHGDAPSDIADFNRNVAAALKPGGVFYVEDHANAPGTGLSGTRTVHRIDDPLPRTVAEGRQQDVSVRSRVLTVWHHTGMA